jgi:hypothetical protein
MNHLKLYEDYKDFIQKARFETDADSVNFKVGDHVKPISNLVFANDDIYKIIKIYSNDDKNITYDSSTNPIDVCDLKNVRTNEIKTHWFLKRFKSAEVEHQSNKFNL